MKNNLTAIISGGQTGADQAGLRAAKTLSINTGGMAPAMYRTEVGPCLELKDDYNLMESDSNDYNDRTDFNVANSDGTVIFGRRSVGSNRTERICEELGKPFVWIWFTLESLPSHKIAPTTTRAFALWLKRYDIKILNVAGNRESKNPGIGQFTEQFLLEALR